MLRRAIDVVLTGARQAVPVGGIFGLGWQPPVAVAVYWVESVLLVAIAVVLCVRLRARTSEVTIAEARAAGDRAYADALVAEARTHAAAGVNPGDVLLFHGASMAIFGLFFAGIVVMLTLNGRIAPVDWAELRDAASGMAVVMALGFAFDYVVLPDPLMWLLGFGGLIAMLLTGRPQIFFQVFAVLKVTWEIWGRLARTFGWKSLQERKAAGLE